MTEPLNLTHLRSLVAVVDRRSFTRAAHVLHLSQSTVSQHVRLLERRVGTELFVREQRGLKLTPSRRRVSDRWARGCLDRLVPAVGARVENRVKDPQAPGRYGRTGSRP